MYRNFARSGSSILSIAIISALSIALAACGSSSHGSSGGTGPTSPAMVNVGDSPADQIVAFAMTINSITLTSSSGATTTVMSSPATVEMTRLIGTQQPLVLVNVPQGTYTSATINTGSAVVSFMNPGNSTPITQTVSVPSKTITFSTPMTVGTTPVVFNFDMDMTQSVAISGNSVTVTPTYTASMGTPGSSNSGDPENGEMRVCGAVASTSGNSFGMSMMESSQTINFATNSSTDFPNPSLSGMGMMGSNQIVCADAMMQQDGTMLAQDVQLLIGSGGVMAEGLMGSVSGSTFSLIAQNGAGGGMMSSLMGQGISVNTTGATYAVNPDSVDMSGLSFVFNSSTISPAQRVQAISSSAMGSGGGMMGGMSMAGSMNNVSQVRLVQQGFSGTVTGNPPGSPATFMLTLDSNSAFKTLTGATTMTVYWQSGTELVGLTAAGITNTATVRVRGLLFHNSGAYQLVASRILAP